jgi:hypothetical protein
MTGVTRPGALAAVALAVLLTAPAPVRAADARLDVSMDGRTWSASLPSPLFDPAVRWVPGDSRTARFWVQNGASYPGRLVVAIQGTRTAALMQNGDLTVTARGGGGTWTSADTPGTHDLLMVAPLAPGARVRVAVGVAFEPSAPRLSQAAALDLALGVRIEPLAGDGDSGQDAGGPPRWWIAAGVGLVGIVAALLARSRKQGASDG